MNDNVNPNRTPTQPDTVPDHKIECQDLLDVLYEYVDGGCDENLRHLLQYRVDACPSCVEQLGVEREVRELLRSRCVSSAPVELRTRITSQLRVVYRER